MEQELIISALGVQPGLEPELEARRRIEFLATYLRASGLESYVLGISGGVDSLAAALLQAYGATACAAGFALIEGQTQNPSRNWPDIHCPRTWLYASASAPHGVASETTTESTITLSGNAGELIADDVGRATGDDANQEHRARWRLLNKP